MAKRQQTFKRAVRKRKAAQYAKAVAKQQSAESEKAGVTAKKKTSDA